MIKIVFCAVISVFPTVLLLTWMRTTGILGDIVSVGVFGNHAADILKGLVCVIYTVFTVMLVAAVRLGGDNHRMGPSR